MLNRRFLIAAVLTVAVAVPVSAQEKWIVVASTTSTRTRASLATFFRCSSRKPIDVKVIAQGPGRPSKLRDRRCRCGVRSCQGAGRKIHH